MSRTPSSNQESRHVSTIAWASFRKSPCSTRIFSRSNRSRSEEHTSELQSPDHLVCRLLLEKKKQQQLSYPSQGLQVRALNQHLSHLHFACSAMFPRFLFSHPTPLFTAFFF